MIFIVVKQPVRAKYADDWPSLVEEFTTATRAEPGNNAQDAGAMMMLFVSPDVYQMPSIESQRLSS